MTRFDQEFDALEDLPSRRRVHRPSFGVPFTQALFSSLVMLVVSAIASHSFAQESSVSISADQLRFFETHVRPMLAEHCWSCHGEKEAKGGLRLDSRSSILAGGDSGAAATPGNLQESLLLEAIRYESLEMPPKAKLADEKIAILTRWIEMGMPWPDAEDIPVTREVKEQFTEEDRAWWAIQPLKKPNVPSLSHGDTYDSIDRSTRNAWQTNPIDAFILTKMHSQKLEPAPEADRVHLLRRLYFDLIGLPPSFTEVEEFVHDLSPNALEKRVDALLASPRYGERWARHWLDLVRYADSDGYRIDHYRPHAWRYRDYVIDAFNHDKPYDRFVQEQLAGDELFPESLSAQVATGFMRHWIYEYNNRDVRGQWTTILNDITDTTSDVFLGLGLQCAKCHDHKFDPLLQRDYFRLQAFFAPLISKQTTVASPQEQLAYAERLAAWERETVAIRSEIQAIEKEVMHKATADALSKFPPDIQAILRKAPEEQTPLEKQLYEIAYRQVAYEFERIDTKIKGDTKEKLLALRKELSQHAAQPPQPLGVAMTVSDVGPIAPDVLIPKRAKRVVLPGYPTLIDPTDASIDPLKDIPSTGRRAALALWLTQPENPLTARVMVNRIWQYHFGRGLAANASDFGKLGGPPTHPELLDWLATTFVENGWSIKQLHRQIVLSATYRQSTHHPAAAEYQTIDPANQYYWRADTRRLDAEQIRDTILFASGQLRQAEVVSLPPHERVDGSVDRIEGGEGVLPDVPRRSIYTRVMRNARDPLLDVFDLPLFFASESSRNTTTTPVQSLLLFNSSEMLRYASLMAERLWKQSDMLESRIELVYQTAFGRSPSKLELDACRAFVNQQAQKLQSMEHDIELVARDQRQTGKIPYRDGQAVFVSHEATTSPLAVASSHKFESTPWSIETYFQIRSIREDATVRTLVSKWSGKSMEPGWSFGVTGKGSRRKPQTLVLVVWGKLRDGSMGEQAIFSDQFVDLNKPYFAAATFEPATTQRPGQVSFYLKDLSNDDDPISIAHVEHQIISGIENSVPLTIGGCGAQNKAVFDGLIDDIRLSKGIVPENRLLLTSEIVTDETLGYWRFESDPGLMRDSSPRAGHLVDLAVASSTTELQAKQTAAQGDKPQAKVADATKSEPLGHDFAAFADLCHVILNSNEFLYVE